MRSYQDHIHSYEDLMTSYESTRAGFVALALEKNRRATPLVAEARALQTAASSAKTSADLLNVDGIEIGLLTAAGLSDKALKYLGPQDRAEAIQGLIKNFLEPAGENFVEELIFRFLLTRGDALGGSMRNVGGILAQRKLTRAILSTLTIAGKDYYWQHGKNGVWIERSDDDTDVELTLRGLSWQNENGNRTLIYNLNIPIVKTNVDMSLFNLAPDELKASHYIAADSYLALGELKGGIDPAGADEHWKTAQTAMERIRDAFSKTGRMPYTFFVGAAIERKMAAEIWNQLKSGVLHNAANLNAHHQVASLSLWLCNL